MRTKAGRSVRALTETALCAALIAASAMIAIPFPVPFTLQLFGVYFALFYLGGVRGTVAVAVYVFLGAVGLPIFSGFSGGFGRLFDATGGFIWGFLLLSLVYLALSAIFRIRWGGLIAAALSLLAFYALGSVWYAFFYTDGSLEGYLGSLLITVAPFALPDAVKLVLAYTLAERLRAIF